MTQKIEFEEKISKFVSSPEMAGRAVELDEDLLASGVLDSLNVARLVSFFEEEFKVSIPMCDLLPENVGTVRASVAYIMAQSSKTAGAR